MEGQYLASEPPGHNARARKGDSLPPPRAPPSHTQPLRRRPSPDFSSLCPPSRKQSVAKGSSTLRQRPPPAEKTQEGTNEYSPIQIFPLLRPPSAATTDRGSERGSIIQKLQLSFFSCHSPQQRQVMAPGEEGTTKSPTGIELSAPGTSSNR